MSTSTPAQPAPPDVRTASSSPENPRLVISWFGGDVQHFELFSEDDFAEWMDDVQRLVDARGWKIDRLGNPIDLIIGAPGRSISRYEFYRFQSDWERVNARYNLRFTGALWLMNEATRSYEGQPNELYIKGVKLFGESIGRPHRARLRRSSK